MAGAELRTARSVVMTVRTPGSTSRPAARSVRGAAVGAGPSARALPDCWGHCSAGTGRRPIAPRRSSRRAASGLSPRTCSCTSSVSCGRCRSRTKRGWRTCRPNWSQKRTSSREHPRIPAEPPRPPLTPTRCPARGAGDGRQRPLGAGARLPRTAGHEAGEASLLDACTGLWNWASAAVRLRLQH